MMGSRRQVGAQLDALALGHGFRVVDGVLRHRTQILVPQLQRHQARVELGELQQVGGQPVEALHLLSTAAQEFLARDGFLGGALEEQFVEGAQGRDGCAQLVADIGQELAAAVAILADDGDRFLQACGHVIERAGKLLYLRRRVVGDVHARVEMALGQQARRLCQPAQGSGQPLGQQERGDERDDQGHQGGVDEHLGDGARGLLAEGVGIAERHPKLTLAGRHQKKGSLDRAYGRHREDWARGSGPLRRRHRAGPRRSPGPPLPRRPRRPARP